MNHTFRWSLAAVAAAAVLSPAVHGASHLWRFAEVFSNADGTIQFIELKECCGSTIETQIQGKWILSNTTANQFNFPNGLVGNTANQRLLFATQHFANLPGAPTPDYIIPEGLFGLNGDTLEYWNYTDSFVAIPALPLDGERSWHCTGVVFGGCTSSSTGLNSPTNFAGDTVSIVAPCRIEDLDISGTVDVDDLVDLILDWGANPGSRADFDLDGVVDVSDLVRLILAWGACP